jgi:ParB family chromosome partitioning protein
MVSDGSLSLENPRTILLADIDASDERFRITTRNDLEDLCASIPMLGLLSPPRMLPSGSRFLIVSGFRRVAACRRLGWDRLTAAVLPCDAALYRCACWAVGDNSTQRPLNRIEAGRSLRLLQRWAPEGRIPPEDAAALGLPLNPSMVSKLTDLCRLPAEAQQGVIDGSIPLAMAVELGRMEPGLAVDLAGIFRELKIGLNRQREMASLITEIARRETIPAPRVMQDPHLAAVLQHPGLDRSQKARQLRKLLRQRRFPALHTAEHNFQALRRQLKLGENIQLTPPPDFEGIGMTLSVVFERLEDLRRLRDKLDELASHPGLQKILEGKRDLFAPAPAPVHEDPAAPR